MLRAVVAIVLATALLGTGLTGVQTAQRERTATHVASEIDRLETAIDDLRAREQATVEPGARRVLEIRLPHRNWGHASAEYIAIGGRPDGGRSERTEPTFAWRVAGGEEHRRYVAGIRVVAAETTGDRPLVLREPGVHRLAISLAWRDGERVALARRLG